MRKMMADKDKELKTILTDEQYKTYENIKQEMKEKMREIKDKRQPQP